MNINVHVLFFFLNPIIVERKKRHVNKKTNKLVNIYVPIF